MADKFPCGKLKAIRIILAMVQNGTDLCFHMQGSNRDIRFNIFVFVAEESFCLQVPEKQLQWKKEPVRAGLWRIVQGWSPGFLSHLCHRLSVTVILPGSDSLYPPSRPGWLTSSWANPSFHPMLPCIRRWHLPSAHRQLSEFPRRIHLAKTAEKPGGKSNHSYGEVLLLGYRLGVFSQPAFPSWCTKQPLTASWKARASFKQHKHFRGDFFNTAINEYSCLQPVRTGRTSKATLCIFQLTFLLPFSSAGLCAQQCSPVSCLTSGSAATSQNSWKSGITGLIHKVLIFNTDWWLFS